MRRAARALGLAAAVGLAACSSSKTPKPASTTAAPASTARPGSTPGDTQFTLDGPVSIGFGGATEVPAEVQRDIATLLDRYLADGMVTPMRSGALASNLDAIFAGPALDRAKGPDRGVLVDDGTTPVGDARVSTATAGLTALVGPDGTAIVSAAVHVAISGHGQGNGDGATTVDRTGELALSRVGGAWKVTGYDMKVDRGSPSGLTTTTAKG